MGFEIFGFGKKKPVEEEQPSIDEMGRNDQAFQAEAEAGMFTVEKDRSSLDSTDSDAINYVVPDMSGLGEPTQERPGVSEERQFPQAGEEGVAWEKPDMTMFDGVTQERILGERDVPVGDPIEYDVDAPNFEGNPDDAWSDPKARVTGDMSRRGGENRVG